MSLIKHRNLVRQYYLHALKAQQAGSNSLPRRGAGGGYADMAVGLITTSEQAKYE